jgi:hypothetical protein
VGKGQLAKDGVTVQIEDERLGDKHLSIQYINNYLYQVKDLDSETGIKFELPSRFKVLGFQ